LGKIKTVHWNYNGKPFCKVASKEVTKDNHGVFVAFAKNEALFGTIMEVHDGC